MDESDNNRSLQVKRSCTQGQGGNSTICSFDSYNHCVGCSSPALNIQHKSTFKGETQLQVKSSEISRISGENAVGSYGKITENDRGEEERSSNYNKSHILRSKGKLQVLLFLSLSSWTNERRENTGIHDGRTSSERESKSNEDNVFKCRNREKNGSLLTILGPLFRVGTLEGFLWREDYPKTLCYLVVPNSTPKWRTDAFMSHLCNNNEDDSFGNNPTVAVEMIENQSDRYRIAKSLNIQLRNSDLRKDYIYDDVMSIAQYGFNHIIIIGTCYCDLLFLDCYERVFKWDAITNILWFFGNFFNAVSEKPVLWDVSSDGTVWELSDLDSPEECNSHPASDKKKKKKGKKKNQKRHH
ncbi:8690_t:CDS:2 [Funneliformis geosporum]|uniref:12475_t:CDS:1 n=1 Tax=Funneliformis geosporum TaxID=1117311 RepID=A0A9W4SBQ1_9GLOM|nr:8690_t:CDS:2 [Funneliformis geosporum]CAI2162772.1 12475_t:CDS:2 [Funneliformis geosporum]